MTNPILVVGEALMDIVIDGGTTVAHPGGSPMNVSLGVSRLGRDAVFATALGDDDGGRAILAHLVESGVTVVPGLEPGRRTSSARVTLDDRGTPSYLFDVDWSVSFEGALPATPRHAHTGSIAAFLTPGAEDVARVIEAARATATISFDPNIRSQFLPDHAAAVQTVEHLVGLADLVKASDEDVAWLYPGLTVDEIAARWIELGAAIVVVTRGGDGASGYTRRGVHHARARRVEVVDSIGAGDSFMSGLIVGLDARGLTGASAREGLQEIDQDTLSELLELAIACGAITVSRAGAQPPWLRELDAGLLAG